MDARLGFIESLPVEEARVDVVISSGVLTLTPDKLALMREVARVVKPGGRIQIGDIVVRQPVPQEAKHDIDLWSGELPEYSCRQSGSGSCPKPVPPM